VEDGVVPFNRRRSGARPRDSYLTACSSA
jgi:hypothetical protein